MSVQAMSWVLDHSESELASRLVLLAIANHCDADGKNAWPSQARLAKEAHVSERTVRRCVTDLVNSGELEVKLYAGVSGGNGRTNYYELSGYIASIEPRSDSPGTDSDTRTDEVDTRTPTTPNPDTCGLRTVHEPSVEPSSSSSVDDDVWIEYGHLKAAASPTPIGAFSRWLPTVIADAKEAIGHKLQPATARWPEATPEQIARLLFDGTEPPKPLEPMPCPARCGVTFDDLELRDAHYATCDGGVA